MGVGAKVVCAKDSHKQFHNVISQGNNVEACAFAVTGMAYYLCKGYQQFNAEIADYMAERSLDLGQTWKFAGGGIGLYDMDSILKYVGITTNGPAMTTNVYSYLKFWAYDFSPVIVPVITLLGSHVILCKKVYTDGTCVFLDPNDSYRVVSIPGEKLPNYYPPWDTNFEQKVGKIQPVLLATRMS